MDIAPPMISGTHAASPRSKAHEAHRAPRSEDLYSLGAIAGVAVPLGVGATRFAQDALLGVTAAGMAALLLVAPF